MSDTELAILKVWLNAYGAHLRGEEIIANDDEKVLGWLLGFNNDPKTGNCTIQVRLANSINYCSVNVEV